MGEFYLITDAAAEEVERLTGLTGRNTPLGALIEKPKRFDLEVELERLDRALNPTKPRCICGKYAIIHRPNCPMNMVVT